MIVDRGGEGHGRAGLIVLICLLIAAIEGYDIQAFGVVAPMISKTLGLGPAQTGWAASAAMMGLMAGAFFGGLIADRVGRKPVLIASVVAFGLFSLLTARAENYDALLIARFATGLGFGGAMPNLIAIARLSSAAVTPVAGMPGAVCASAGPDAVNAVVASAKSARAPRPTRGALMRNLPQLN